MAGRGAGIDLFHSAYEPDVIRPVRLGLRTAERGIQAVVESRRKELERLAEQLQRGGVRACASVRWDYPPHEAIVRQALRIRPHLVVASSTRHARAARLLLTQTDYRLIELCPYPLLLLETERPYLDARVVAAVDPLHVHDKPAALDAAIVEAASELSRAIDGELHVYHACPSWLTVSRESPELRRLHPTLEDDVRTRYREAAARRVADVAQRGAQRARYVL